MVESFGRLLPMSKDCVRPTPACSHGEKRPFNFLLWRLGSVQYQTDDSVGTRSARQSGHHPTGCLNTLTRACCWKSCRRIRPHRCQCPPSPPTVVTNPGEYRHSCSDWSRSCNPLSSAMTLSLAFQPTANRADILLRKPMDERRKKSRVSTTFDLASVLEYCFIFYQKQLCGK